VALSSTALKDQSQPPSRNASLPTFKTIVKARLRAGSMMDRCNRYPARSVRQADGAGPLEHAVEGSGSIV